MPPANVRGRLSMSNANDSSGFANAGHGFLAARKIHCIENQKVAPPIREVDDDSPIMPARFRVRLAFKLKIFDLVEGTTVLIYFITAPDTAPRKASYCKRFSI